ncbi:PQQ-dependent sugar dehydrogenase [Marisediminicola sp. LYQ134]|uniref:PQQ-dependent sugar dehydrogenase n=1 Tax=unclassified Marisediminicola TaxID=2618316 RepID=UPI003983AEC9
MRRALTPTTALGGAALALTLAVSGCASPAAEQPTPLPPAPSPSETTDAPAAGPVEPVGEPSVVATGLEAPWSIAPLADGSALVSERDTAMITSVSSDGEVADVGVIDGVTPGGEGGLLGIAVLEGERESDGGDDSDATWLYAYFTASADNRIVRMPLDAGAGGVTLGAPETVLEGIPKANTHNGGRIAFGPDGHLYATVGDANVTDAAQDVSSLSGKILRMTPDGATPDDNPFDDSLVYSLGHRNPQGIAWDDDGRLWASEFGQNTWDEVNLIEPGENYGWPVVEGIGDDPAYVDPEYQWSTDEASPSGLAHIGGTLFMAALRGERVWALYPDAEEEVGDGGTVPYFQGQFGRIRDVAEGPDGSLWVLTNNTDGRGEPRDGDDQIIRVQLAPLVAD